MEPELEYESFKSAQVRNPIVFQLIHMHTPTNICNFYIFQDIRSLLVDVWAQTKLLCSSEFIWRTFLACAIQFCLTTSYYTLMLWFPELFDRFENFEKNRPGESASLCDISNWQRDDSPTDCSQKHIDDSVFLHTIYVGLACLPTSFWLPLCVHRLGTKFFLGKKQEQAILHLW